jgi:hypothetical protein
LASFGFQSKLFLYRSNNGNRFFLTLRLTLTENSTEAEQAGDFKNLHGRGSLALQHGEFGGQCKGGADAGRLAAAAAAAGRCRHHPLCPFPRVTYVRTLVHSTWQVRWSRKKLHDADTPEADAAARERS